MRSGEQASLRLISGRDADPLGLSWEVVINVLRAAFEQKARGLVENPPKPAVHPRRGAFAHAMPAYLGGSDALGCKWVSGYPRPGGSWLPAVQGLVIVNDAATGRPACVIDGGWLTSVRTAGVSALVARQFGKASRRLAVVGCGREGRSHLAALLQVCPHIAEVRAYNPRREKAEKLLAVLERAHGALTDSAEEAITGCDLVVTATPMDSADRETLDDRALARDALILPIDFDRCWSGEAVRQSALFCVDDRRQFEHFKSAETFAGYPLPTAELAELLRAPGHAPMEGHRFFFNLGLAMADVAVGTEVWRRAAAADVGTSIAWCDDARV
jgi:ornithine cyclodeaminase/alanine dehydrogenase-like protein (mu-crystallin family)